MTFNDSNDRVILCENGLQVRFGDIVARVNEVLEEGIDTAEFAEWAADHLANYGDWLKMVLVNEAAERIADIYLDEA